MGRRDVLPNGGGNGAPNGPTDPGPKRQQSNDGGHVLVRDGSLGCHTGADHAECTTKRNKNLCPYERDIAVQILSTIQNAQEGQCHTLHSCRERRT